jgi:hypothetical protein
MLFLALTALFYGFKTTILLRRSKVFPEGGIDATRANGVPIWMA